MGFLNFFKKEKNKNIDTSNNISNEITASDDEEIAAVIGAVLASMDDEEETVAAITAAISCIIGKQTGEFIVRNIKRTPELDSIWAHAGRMKLMR